MGKSEVDGVPVSSKAEVPPSPKEELPVSEKAGIKEVAIDDSSKELPIENSSNEESENEDQYPHGFKLASLITALCMAVFLVALDQTIIATAIPRITDRFKSINDIGWYGSAYFLTSTALQPTFGRIYKVFNIKIVCLVAIFIFEIGSLICAVAPSSTVLIVGRAIAGIGVGGIFSGGLVILAHSVPLRKRPLIMGFFGAMWGLASVAGPLLGGVFTDKVSWRWCFYINLPIGGVSMVVVAWAFQLPGDNEHSGKPILQRLQELDLIGASILIPAIICLLLAVQWGGSTYPWNSSRIIGLFVGAGLMLILFGISQWWLDERATILPRLLRQRTVVAASMYAFFFGAGIFAMMYYLPLYLQSVKGSSPTRSGIQVLPLMLSTVFTSIVGGICVTVFGYYTPFLIGGMVLMTIGTGLITTFEIDTPFAKWFGYQIIMGLGAGFGFQIPLVAVQTVLSIEDIPQGSVMIMFMQSLGGALFLAVTQSVFQNGLIKGVGKYAPDLDPNLMVHTGATEIRNTLTEMHKESEIIPAIMAYVYGLKDAYRVILAVTAVGWFFSCLLEWKSVKKEGKPNAEPVIAV